ncbi:MAG: protease inhibitor I42 family protein [Desulfobacterales bacterium]
MTRVDDGNTIEVRKGDRIVVRLDENPTTGYSWALDKDAGDSVALQNSDFSRPGETVPGAGGQRDFTFAARNEGSANLIFKRWRQWEGDTSIVERVGFTVRVVDTSADDK